MYLVERIYRLTHREKDVHYKYKYPLWHYVMIPIRKYMSAVVIPTIPFNGVRVLFYRMLGYKIGKGCFIGMRCYFDDFCYKDIIIGNNVTISYGVYFACHGRRQGHHKIIIEDKAYVGMKASIICPKGDVIIGKEAVIGTMTLVNKSVPPKTTAVGVPARFI